MLFDEIAELAGQRNAIDGRLVEIVAELDAGNLCGMTGARSVPSLVAWKLGMSPNNADTFVDVARRSAEFPLCTAALREGRLSVDQVGVIAERAADGSDEHYAKLAESATVTQLRQAIRLEPRPEPDPEPPPDIDIDCGCGPEAEFNPDCPCYDQPEPASCPEAPRSFSKTAGEQSTTYRITLPHAEAATFDAAVQSHTDGLVADWKRDHPDGAGENTPPFPTQLDGFTSLVEAGWDTEVARRPHGQRTTVVVHVDLDTPGAALHLGPLLSSEQRRYLTCDADCEAWFQRNGQVIGSGRATRTISRRLRRVLEHRDRCCVVPGCGATRGLHAHHVRRWEDGGPTELHNLVLLCPFHHRLHHSGGITITGPADQLVVTDTDGQPLSGASLARPPTTPPPAVQPYKGPTGERADWWWYDPFQPKPPPTN